MKTERIDRVRTALRAAGLTDDRLRPEEHLVPDRGLR